MNDNDESPITDFYRGKTVFLTGVTGFLGQCLLVKLLRTGVKSVFILIRESRNQSPQERFNKLIQSPIFELLKEERPNFINDIILISGTLDEIELKISSDDQGNLFKNVEIIIHAAADIRFDMPLKTVALRNVRGTRELLRLANKMENFINFVYISTAYAFCFRNVTDEEFYMPPLDGETLITIAENAKSEEDEEILNTVCSKVIAPWPNTYTFSKAITENLVQQYRQYFDVTIIRPSIVTAAYREPIEGWNTNFAGLNGVLCGISAGILRCIEGKKETALDTVCCDFVVNSVLAATFHVSNNSDTVPVFNVISSNDFVMTIEDILDFLYSYRNCYIPMLTLWYPFGILNGSYFTFFICNLFLHVIPAVIIDTYLKIKGKKPRILKIYRLVHMFGDVLRFFLNNTFKFENNNMKMLCKNMTSKDKMIFPCDFGTSFNWNEYQDIYIFKGIVEYLLKEIPDRKKMRRNARKLCIIHYTFVVLCSVCIAYSFWLLLKFFLKY